MQRFSRLAILVLVFAASVSQAQTSRSTGSYYNRTDDSDAELNLDGPGTDYDGASTNAKPGSVMARFEFLRNIDEGIIREFGKAWCVADHGASFREGVVLIFRRTDGSYMGISQGFSNESQGFTFKWKPNALAIVHTHPNVCNPEPSAQDQRVAEKLDVPIFTITIRGMYVYDPATKKTGKVLNGLDWLKLSRWTRESKRTNALADRLEQGTRALATFASALTDAQWQTRVHRDGRKIGVIVHHVATMYPLVIELAHLLASGKPVEGVTWDAVHEMNAKHAKEYDAVTKEEEVDLLRRNSTAAAIRALSDEELDQAAPISLNSDAPLTCQFMLEDHGVRHSYHHLARIRAALKRV